MNIVKSRVIKGEKWQPGDLSITQWEEPAEPLSGNESQDASGIFSFDNPSWRPGASQILRLVVADGVTSNPTTPTVNGLNGAVFASQTAVEHFGKPIDQVAAATQANQFIEDKLIKQLGADDYEKLPRKDRPRTMAAAVDIVVFPDDTWELDLFNVGDCDIRIFIDGVWLQPIPEMGYKKEVMDKSDEFYREVDNFYSKNPHLSKDQAKIDKLAKDAELFASPDAFDSTPIGGFPTNVPLKYTTTRIQGKGPLSKLSLLVFTDGLREPKNFDYKNTRNLLVQMSNPSAVSANALDLKRRDDKALIAIGTEVSLLPDDVQLPEPGRFVIGNGETFNVRTGSIIQHENQMGLNFSLRKA